MLGYWYGALVVDERKQSEYSHVISSPVPRHRHSSTSFLFEHSYHSAETGDSSLPHHNSLFEGVYCLFAVSPEKDPSPAYKPNGQDERSLRTGAVSLSPPAYTYTYVKEILETNQVSYEKYRQNNAHLSSLSSKVSALRSVTMDIHDNARDHETLDHSVRSPSFLSVPKYNFLSPRQVDI